MKQRSCIIATSDRINFQDENREEKKQFNLRLVNFNSNEQLSNRDECKDWNGKKDGKYSFCF